MTDKRRISIYTLQGILDQVNRDILQHKWTITDKGESVDTLEKITEHWRKTGLVKVWTGASDNTIFTKPYYNWLFRAWHDKPHIGYQYPFDPQGEAKTCQAQVNDVNKLVKNAYYAGILSDILSAEINGQIEYANENGGEFPENQREFMLEYLDKRYNLQITY